MAELSGTQSRTETPESVSAGPKQGRPASTPQLGRGWKISDNLLALLIFVVLVLVWEFGVKLAGIRPIILPPLSGVAQAMWQGLYAWPLARESYVWHALVTASEALLGLGVGAVLGIALGVVIAQSRRTEKFLLPYILAIQSLPKVALAPLFIIWFGYGIQSKVWIVVLLTFFPLLVNTIAGLRSVDPDMVDMARAAGGSRWTIFRRVSLPMALPYIFAGLDMAVVYSIVGAIVGEFVGASQGLGVLIQQMTIVMDTQGTFSVLIMLSLIGILFSTILKVVRRRVLFWAPSERLQITS